MPWSPGRWRYLALVLGYGLAFVLLFQVSELYWYPPAGLRFAILLLAPLRLFPWLVLGEMLFTASTNLDHIHTHGWPAAWPFLFKPLAAALGPWLLRSRVPAGMPGSPEVMAQLLGAMALSSIAAAVATSFYPFAQVMAMPWPLLVLQLVLGDFVGMLLLVPLALMLFLWPPDRSVLKGWKRDIGLFLVPSLLLFVVWNWQVDLHQLRLFGVVLCVLPITCLAFRSGWRGVAMAFPMASSVIAASGRLVPDAGQALDLQMVLVAVGSVNLLLGVAVDALRASQHELGVRNDRLTVVNHRLDSLADELRDAARRNMGLSEGIRRWVAAEVHDEFGQNLTALQTHIKLIEKKMGQPEAFQPVRGILRDMRTSVSGLLTRLRPAGLDEFGLVQALKCGSIRDLVEASGMAYQLHVRDPGGLIEHLEDDYQTAIYRVVQEAATNAVRHAGADSLFVRLAVREGETGIKVFLLVGDDGSGFGQGVLNAGVGLLGIRDRVVALGGNVQVRSRPGGICIRVSLLQLS